MNSSPQSDLPRLEAVAGPRQGEVFPLEVAEISIGREPSNDIAILDSSISRRHCLVIRTADGIVVRDLDSRNSTFVNDEAVGERVLAPGDRVRLGKTTFVLLAAGARKSGRRAVAATAEPGTAANSVTVVLRPEEGKYRVGGPLGSGGSGSGDASMVRGLDLLLRFSNAAAGATEGERLRQLIVDMALEAVPADRASVFVAGEGTLEGEDIGGAGITTAVRSGKPDSRSVAVSRTIAGRVLGGGEAILTNDVSADEALQGAESLIVRRVRSVLAVPLEAQGSRIGLLYLETTRADSQFDNDHLELMAAFGHIAALALASVRRLEWLAAENRRLENELGIETGLIGESAPMKVVNQFIARVAPREANVLVHGESGTGKELVARAVHRNSPRATGPFVAINCAAITETLLE
ncbi:MAG: FHA domain-containing protein, partial [Bryobacteraceae bacterium]